LLGPDCLNHPIFDVEQIKQRLLIYSKRKGLLISEALLNQKIVAGIGNKYKSEILLFLRLTHLSKYSNLI
jgi:formamidopyrimidine-DNA glycosylase